jgi:hypothetical protein
MSLISRFLIFAAVALPGSSLAAEPVGTVSKLMNEATVSGRPATVGAAVSMNEELRTGANGRLQVTFRDNSSLTLGENAKVVIDRYVFNPDKSTADVILNATRGAIRFAGGKIEQMHQKTITVNTPNAALAVRGTHFWAGPINGKYGVLLLNGNVRVSKR